MLELFYPDLYLDSAYQIDFGEYHKKGYRGVIFDIDNTLVPHGAPADARSIELIGRLKEMGFGVVFLSNNKEPRVKMFNDAVHAEYIYKAGKPGKKGYLKAMEMMRTGKHSFCGGPALHRRVGRQEHRDFFDFSASYRQKRRDPDRFEALSGKDCARLLQAKVCCRQNAAEWRVK